MLDPFILRAIIGIAFASLSVPVSVLMLLRGSLYITSEVSHAALGGAAIGVLIQTFIPDLMDPFFFVVIFCIATSILVSRAGKSGQQSLGMMLSVSLAVSVMLYAVIRSYLPIEKRVIVDSYLVSDLLLLSNFDILNLAIASTVTVIAATIFYREFIYICFDMETAEALGLKTGLYDSLLFTISAVTVAVVSRMMGVLLSVTLLIIPAAASRLLTRHIDKMLVGSFLIAFLSGLGGILLSLYSHIPTSGAVALISILVFSLIYIIQLRKPH
mgnify:CR=1 FL=1